MRPVPRIIPVLLLARSGLAKGVQFREHGYVGDPINAMRIFNEKDVDEVILLDIEARIASRPPDLELIARIADECYVPLAVGGGISRIEDVDALIRSGIEKVILNTGAVDRPELIGEVANRYGAQSATVAIDYLARSGENRVYAENGTRDTGLDALAWARCSVEHGAGEVLLNCISRDGTGGGYDLDLVTRAVDSLTVPVVAGCGAGSVDDLRAAARAGASAAAGSLFVYFGRRRSVLITYPINGRRMSVE